MHENDVIILLEDFFPSCTISCYNISIVLIKGRKCQNCHLCIALHVWHEQDVKCKNKWNTFLFEWLGKHCITWKLFRLQILFKITFLSNLPSTMNIIHYTQVQYVIVGIIDILLICNHLHNLKSCTNSGSFLRRQLMIANYHVKELVRNSP